MNGVGCSEVAVSSTAAEEVEVCRDFLRNVCRRGRRCRYPHPALSEVPPVVAAAPMPAAAPYLQQMQLQPMSFCHDYQNSQCARPSCRFLHCTQSEQEQFWATGELPAAVLEDAIARGAEIRLSRNDAPVCKDFTRGECSRGARCKYRHLTVKELELWFSQRAVDGAVGGGNVVTSDGQAPATHVLELQTAAPTIVNSADLYEPPEGKRRLVEDYGGGRRSIVMRDYRTQPSLASHAAATAAAAAAVAAHVHAGPMSLIDYRGIDEDNRILHRQVQELKKQVEDLTTTNEFLLDQNAQLRMDKRQHAAAAAGVTGLATVTVPTVSLSGSVPTATTLTMAPGQTAQVMTVPGSMAGIAVPVTLTHTPGSAAMAVSLAPVSMQQAVAQSSMSSIQMTPMSSIQAAAQSSMQPSIQVGSIQMAPMSSMQAAQSSMPSIQVAPMSSIQGAQTSMPPMQVNGPVACSISGGPVVSYPIMSQQLRPLHPVNITTQ